MRNFNTILLRIRHVCVALTMEGEKAVKQRTEQLLSRQNFIFKLKRSVKLSLFLYYTNSTNEIKIEVYNTLNI